METKVMTKEEFGEALIAGLTTCYPNAKVDVCSVHKTNLVATIVVIREEGCNIAPNVRIDALYDRYMSEQITIEEAIEHVSEQHEAGKDFLPSVLKMGIEDLTDFESVKHKVVSCVINTERNVELLRKVVHFPFRDLSVVFRVLLGETEDGWCSAVVTKELMQEWNLSECELLKVAQGNSKYELVNVNDLTVNRMEYILENERLSEDERLDLENTIAQLRETNNPLYAVTCDFGYGAAMLLNNDVLQTCALVLNCDDFYILPSSIHECLVISKEHALSSCELSQIVREANATLIESDFLSDSVYEYNSLLGEVEIVDVSEFEEDDE